MGYARFAFRDFESYPRIIVGLDAVDYTISFKTI